MTTRLDAASVRARLALSFALTLLALVFASSAQAAAPDFTWTSTVSTTQAAGHPNMTFNYASSSTQSLTRLDVDLPQGLMHSNKMTHGCNNPMYLTDSCPAGSTVGTVSAQLVVARVTVTVPGTIYQLSEPTGGADATFGIVLRPPLSGLGLTGKILIRNQISFTNGGGLRSSLVGPLNSITVGGTSLPSRIAQLKLAYNSQTPTGGVALISNPTSCKAQTFTATGTFSDGTTRPRTSSFSTTGCPAVPFAPTVDVQLLNNTAGQKSTVLVVAGSPGGSPTAALHTGHVVAIGHDFDQLGDFDLAAIDAGPLCTDAQAATSACPAGSQLGELSVDIEGFGTATGKVFATNSPGHKTVGEITLRQGVTARFAGTIGGANGSTLTLTGLPQLPLTSMSFKWIKAGIFLKEHGCAATTSTTRFDSYSGARVDRTVQHPAPNCAPQVAPQITAGPDRGITINTTHVEYRFTSPEADVTFECKKDDAEFAACASPFVDDWQAEKAHVFSVRSVRGGLAGPAVSATFTIDTMPPTVDFVNPDDADVDNDGYADSVFRDTNFSVEFSASDATSGLAEDKLDCSISNPADPKAPVLHGKIGRSYTAGRFICEFVSAPPGPGIVSVTAYDFAGHVAVHPVRMIITSQQPAITVNEKRAMYTDAPTAEVPFEAFDETLKYPQGDFNVECSRKGWDGTVKGGTAKIITDRDTGRSKGFCVFPDIPEGTFKVIVRGWDPQKKEATAEGDLVVDRSAPEIKFTNPDDADGDNDGFADKRFRPSFFDVFTEISDLGSGVDPAGTSCVAKVKNGGMVNGNINVIQANRVACSVAGLPDGDVDVEITARNYVGTVTIVKRGFTVDTAPPVVTFADAGDVDADGDGFAEARVRAARLGFHVWVEDSRSGIDPNSGACVAKNRKGGMVNGNVVINNGSLRCSFDGLADGDTDIEISVADNRGLVTVVKTAVTIDSSIPPEG